VPVPRKSHTAEYKLEAIRLASGPESNVKKAAEALGIPEGLLYRWIRAHKKAGKGAFPGKGVVSRDEELFQLRRDLKRVTEERDFLKKTATFFARELK
jgi:transposase